MGTKESGGEAVSIRRRAGRAPKRKIETEGRLVNLSRGAELLDVAYDTVAKAAEEKELAVAFMVEGKGGRAMPVVTVDALNAYRLRAIARFASFHSEYHRARVAALEARAPFLTGAAK